MRDATAVLPTPRHGKRGGNGEHGSRPSMSSVLVIDDNQTAALDLTASFAQRGFQTWIARDHSAASLLLERECPDVILAELKIGSTWVFDLLEWVKARWPQTYFAIVTSYPSIASAVRSVRSGVDCYLIKPVNAQAVLQSLAERHVAEVNSTAGEACWPSLDRIVWEHLNQMLFMAGSVSETARRLGVDRRSLRRMLNKYPPPR
jgi:two-component system response regulator RegA